MEYAEEVCWTGGRSACRKLGLPQMKKGSRLKGDPGWRKPEGSDKVMFGKRLEGLEEER